MKRTIIRVLSIAAGAIAGLCALAGGFYALVEDMKRRYFYLEFNAE